MLHVEGLVGILSQDCGCNRACQVAEDRTEVGTPATTPIFVIRAPPTLVQLAFGLSLCAIAMEHTETRRLGTSARSVKSTPVVMRVVNLLRFINSLQTLIQANAGTVANRSAKLRVRCTTRTGLLCSPNFRSLSGLHQCTAGDFG